MFDADQLIVPPGMKTGLLMPEHPPGTQFPMAADHIDVIPQSDWPSMIDEDMSIRQFVKDIHNQGSNGSCASEAMTQGVATTMHASGGPYVRMNALGVYGRVNGGSDSGSSIMANLRFGQQYGCFPESVWPRSKGWRARPSEEAYEAAKQYRIQEVFEIGNWTEFGSALLLGFPVVFGYSGHSIVAVQLLSTSRFVYANSWDERWGDNGFGTISASSIYWPYGAYCIRTTTPNQDEAP
jgi:hypothetical protein